MSYAIFTAFAVLFAQQNPAMAQGAQPALRGKSITINWSENKTEVVPGGGTRANITSQNLVVYVSDKGQVFARRTVSNRRNMSANRSTLGSSSGRTVAATQFSGRSMNFTWGAGAESFLRRFTVEFDDGFNGCTATVIAGLTGRTAVIADPINGGKITIQAVSASGYSCSVRAGNAFL